MKATINGELRELPDGTTIANLLESLGIARSGIAIAKNDKVIRRSHYEDIPIADGDNVEIIKAVAGG
ncbi:MAG TPA: sulfur carrier protein ThiS [Candidatus Baltobacteraceae bacterium]|nr:sulfur carrier protein ThiS [Candidatus Baltobacteraceae bacterium]